MEVAATHARLQLPTDEREELLVDLRSQQAGASQSCSFPPEANHEIHFQGYWQLLMVPGRSGGAFFPQDLPEPRRAAARASRLFPATRPTAPAASGDWPWPLAPACACTGPRSLGLGLGAEGGSQVLSKRWQGYKVHDSSCFCLGQISNSFRNARVAA